MPKKSSSGKGAYYFFTTELMAKQGRKFKNFEAASAAAGPIWEKMNAEQRQPYVAKAAKGNGVKMTTLQEEINLVSKFEEDLKKEEIHMKQDIDKMIAKSAIKKQLPDKLFHIIHINNFCYANCTDKNYPAEIAIIRFNLNHGALNENIFHEIIKPGALPSGYSFNAKQTSADSHQLPAPMGKDAPDTQGEVIQNMLCFLDACVDDETKDLPPLFVNEKIIRLVRKVFDTWCYDFEYDRGLFKIYSLQYLFYVLRNNVNDEAQWPSPNLSAMELTKDIYDYTPDISCEYHEMNEVLIHCSKSIVTRYVYLICDNCCPVAGIQMIAGQHVPKRSDTKILNRDFDDVRSNASFRSTASSGNNRRSKAPSVAGSESHLSFVTDTNTVVDDGDWEHGSLVDEEDDGWVTAKSGKHRNTSSSRGRGIGAQFYEYSCPAASPTPPTTSTTAKAPLRRPNSISAAAGGGVNGHVSFPARGRGRGNWKYEAF